MRDKIFQLMYALKNWLIDILKKLFMDKLNPKIVFSFYSLLDFWKHNPAYLICTICYFFICESIINYSFMLILVYVISLLIVFSSLGEKILRLLNRVRPLETKQETEYLQPLFDEVYIRAKELYSYKLPDIKICIIDNMTVNAMALGRHTIAVTKGAMKTFTEDELKAVMAHEIAHIVHGDTVASLYALIGNGILSVFVLFFRLCLSLLDWLKSAFVKKRGLISFFLSFFQFCFELSILVINFGFQVILSVNQRKNEFGADKFSYAIGYDTDMIEALYLLEKISLGDNSSIIQKMTSSHPRITLRIKKLEELDEQM